MFVPIRLCRQAVRKQKKSDKLILGNRTFYIIDLDEVGSFGISTIYYAEERKDVK